MFAKIYQPAPSAMTSGRSSGRPWVLEFARKNAHAIDPLTGTNRSTDMYAQLELKFDSLEEAVSYAKKNAIAHRVVQAKTVKRVVRHYADNFCFDRKLPWTH